MLRSFTFTQNEDGRKAELSLTTTVKDGTYFIKGFAKEDGKTIVDVSYQQKSNDKGSAGGELLMNIHMSKESDESGDTSGSAIGNELLTFDSLAVSLKFDGQKTGNKVTIDSKLELSMNQGGLKVSFPIDIAIKYDKVSDSENEFSVNLAANIMDFKFDMTVSGGRSLIEYAEVKVPADDEVEVVGESFDFEAILTKFMAEYPGAMEFFRDVLGVGDGSIEKTGKFIYTENEQLSAYLYDDGTGLINAALYNVQYKDNQYTAELYDGSELSGKYVQNGASLVIDDVGGYTYATQDGMVTISNEDAGCYIYFDSEGNGQMSTFMQYRIENGKIQVQLGTGGLMEFSYAESGGKIMIGDVAFSVIDLSGETGTNI